MERKGINIAVAVVVGFFAGFVMVAGVYFLAVTMANIIVFSEITEFGASLLHAFDNEVLFLVGFSVAFVIITLFSLRSVVSGRKRFMRISRVVLFFVITAAAIFYWILKIPIRLGSFPGNSARVIISIAFVILGALVFFSFVRHAFYTVYYVLLRLFMVNQIGEYIPPGEGGMHQERIPEYQIFIREFESNISINKRYGRPFALLGFRMNNQLDLIKRYSSKGYDHIEHEVITYIRRHSRLGENQCLVQKGAIFSLLFADEEGAQGAARRYSELLDNARFTYRKEEVPVDISIGVSGIDFSKYEHKESPEEIRDAMLLSILDVLTVAASKHETYVVFG